MSSRYRPHVLFVDDNPEVRMLIEELLEERCEITSASSAEKALRVLGGQKVDLFLLDIRLGAGRNGVELLHLLRDFEPTAQVPAVALTTYGGPDNREALLAEGFDEHVSKPFFREELIGAIDGALSGRPFSGGESSGGESLRSESLKDDSSAGES